jgi:hypothetical protein
MSTWMSMERRVMHPGDGRENSKKEMQQAPLLK